MLQAPGTVEFGGKRIQHFLVQLEILLDGMPGFVRDDRQVGEVRGLMPGNPDDGDGQMLQHWIVGPESERLTRHFLCPESAIAAEKHRHLSAIGKP